MNDIHDDVDWARRGGSFILMPFALGATFIMGVTVGQRPAENASGAHEAADCILAHVPEAHTERGVYEVVEACRAKYPVPNPVEALPDMG